LTIEEISSEVFYNMEKYSQAVLDLVSEVEDMDENTSFGAIKYEIGNILEIICKERKDDIKILKQLDRILTDEIEVRRYFAENK